MKFIPQSISDVVLIKPTVHGDSRGYFAETFRQDLFEKSIGSQVNFIQAVSNIINNKSVSDDLIVKVVMTENTEHIE